MEPGRWGNRRALTTAAAAVVMILVIAVVGAGAYFGFNSIGGNSPTTKTSCAPATSPACAPFSNTHDVSLLAPITTVQQGNPVPFTAILPSGEIASTYMYDFGDNSNSTTSSSTASHSYAGPGAYIVSVQAQVGTVWHDSYKGLVVVKVTNSAVAVNASDVPTVSGTLVSNSTSATSTTAPTAVLQPGQSITVSGTYTGFPTNPAFTPSSPSISSSSGGLVSAASNTTTSATGTVTFANAGTGWVKFVVPSVGPGGVVVHNDYTWTVFVATSGFNAGVAGQKALAKSPHPGSIVAYELVPGGSTSEDPAIDYETAGYEPILNVYQTLIAYNGSDVGPTPASYVPEIATCIPGSSAPTGQSCQALYGNSLVFQNNYTFVISAAPQFYDPATGNHWGVYPTDVMFSIFRTMGFSTLPGFGSNNGWILAQSLLGPGNTTYAPGAAHGAFNNTPGAMFATMSINSTSCPAVALTQEHGCVTFHASGGGISWPYFLELIGDPLGGSIVPCGWFSAPAQGAGIPYWTAGNVSGSGDHPCALPGTGGYGVAPASTPVNGYDNWEVAGSGANGGTYLGNVQWHMAGSGPYYMKLLSPGTSYILAANPAWAPNAMCTWLGCQPAAGKYAGSVSVVWEQSQIQGEQAYQAGVADFASIPSTDAAFLLQLIQAGKLGASSAPSISVYFFPYNFNFASSKTGQFTSVSTTIPADFFSHVGMRQFFAHAYPYQTIQNTISTKDGIQYLFNYGGAIPQFMTPYYANNVSWPSGDPCTDTSNPNCAGYWWAQMTTTGSPYYDAEAVACKTTACSLPLFGQTGAPDLDQRMALWSSSLATLSSGAVKMTPVDVNFGVLVTQSLANGPGQQPFPVYTLGWAPDYPDPTDYVIPMYQANSTYTYGDAVAQQTESPAFSAAACGHGPAELSYWSSHAVPDNCQGQAYMAMNTLLALASSNTSATGRVLLYNMASNIANALAFDTWWGQANTVSSFSIWIDGTTLNSNITIGGGGDQTWFTIQGNGVLG
jgi:peptide/nickel transport system substrate-binding protein